MRNNKSATEQWTAFVKRNPLVWATDPVNLKIEEGEYTTFTARITNTGGTNVSFAIENLPSWLSVNSSMGNLQPLSNRDLTFTVYQGINVGNYEIGVGLSSGNGVTEILPVQLKVTGQRPDWNVNPSDFESTMNIIGQVKIDGVFQEDPDDLLAAFIDNLCVGITSPMYVDENNAFFTFANIYGNSQQNNKPLVFKLWDASTGRIYPQIETSVADIKFAPSMMIGNFNNPVIFNALDVAEQVIPLTKGWNWISANVLNENPDILTQMKQSLSTTGEIIKGRDAYIQQPNWSGTLTEISEKSMYSVRTTDNHSLVLTGQYANPATTPIEIAQGWNHIGYIPAFTMTIKSALAGLNAQTGDQIKGQTGFATYAGSSGWIGNLSFMQSGKGYMYYSGNSTTQTFNYPSSGSQGIMPAPPNSSVVDARWSVNAALYSNSMTITAVVVNDDVEMRSDMVEIGAFSGSECRGTIVLQYVETLNRYVGFLMIYGHGNEPITLKVYDHATNMEYDANNAPISFIADAIWGSPSAPFIVALGTTSGVEELTIDNGELTILIDNGQLTMEEWKLRMLRYMIFWVGL
jgi:hypothetical protein